MNALMFGVLASLGLSQILIGAEVMSSFFVPEITAPAPLQTQDGSAVAKTDSMVV